MRIFAISDLHVDYEVNAQWITTLSRMDYRDDVLILAGDISDVPSLLSWCLRELASRFRKVLYVPGNHELWVMRDGQQGKDSLQKFAEVCSIATSSGASMQPFHSHGVSILPLLGWYDYSFGRPGTWLESAWMDFHACRWPEGFDAEKITAWFTGHNDLQIQPEGKVITFSHFLPRIDVMPDRVSTTTQKLFPIFGSARLDFQLRHFKPMIHVYGHSHLNRNVTLDGINYINNAYGYPKETRIAAKRLLCIHEC